MGQGDFFSREDGDGCVGRATQNIGNVTKLAQELVRQKGTELM